MPYGAHPTSFFPLYGYDGRFHLDWAKVSRDADQTQEFPRTYVLEPGTQADYLEAVGGVFFGEQGHGLVGMFQRNEYRRYSQEIRRRRGRVFVLTGTASAFRASALAMVAAARAAGITYSRLIEGLKAAKISLDRKVLADLAVFYPEDFSRIVELAQKAA
mgnify:CR=1 FL=1